MEIMNGVKARSWPDITMQDFFFLKSIEDNKSLSLLQKRIKTLSALSGSPESEVRKLNEAIINGYFENELAFLNSEVTTADLKDYYFINGKKYSLIRQIDDLTAGQFIDLQEYSKDADNILDSLHLILTVFLIPVRDLTPKRVINNKLHRLVTKVKPGKKLANTLKWKYNEGIPENYMETPCSITADELYQHMKISDAMSIMLFFCVLGELFSIVTHLYLEETMKKQLTSVSKILNEQDLNPQIKEQAQKQISSLQGGIGS